MFWSNPSGAAAEAREAAIQAVDSLTKSGVEMIKEEIAKAAAKGKDYVSIHQKQFGYNPKVMDACAKELRSQGFRVTNRYLGMGLRDFTVTW